MSESNEINTESDKFGIFVNQTYETSKGNKFEVTNIARESGNIEDFFVVYKNISQDNSEQSWVKNINELENLENFDDAKYPELEESEEKVSIGQRYQHFKTKDFYLIKDIARDPANPSKKYIIYEGQYDSPEFGDHPVWIREYEDFTGMKVFKDDELDQDGNKKEPVKRFALIN
jgi:hypothetical protein